MGTALGLALGLGFGGYKVPAWLKAWKTYSDTSLTATPASDTAMDLAWTNPNISGVTLKNVVVEISTDGVTFTEAATLGVVTSTQVTGLTAGTLYYYRLKFVSSRNITTSAGTSVGARTIDYVDYIQSSGTQYIDTGITPTNNTGVKGKTYMSASGGYSCPGGTLNYNGSTVIKNFNMPKIYSKTGDNILTYTHNASFIYITRIEGPNTLEFEQNYNNSGNILVNGVSKAIIKNVNSYTHSIQICRLNGEYEPIFRNATYSGILYYLELTEESNIVGNYKPALNPDGQFCMFDEVSKTYKTNAGTGYFKGGGVTSAMIDARLIQYAAAGVSGVTIDFTGADNGTRSSASDAAVTTLTTAGCTILVNP